MVIWLVGLSGSGKTTIGKEIYKLWKPLAPNTVMVDGDVVRRITGHDISDDDYTVEGRNNNAKRIVEICSWLDCQDINVICCILCIFDDIMINNYNVYSSYYQVFLDAPIELLKKRDPKGLYAKAIAGKEKNVVGIDIPYKPPSKSDYVLRFDQTTSSPAQIALDILDRSGVKI